MNQAASGTMIDVQHLVKRFGYKTVLHDLFFKVERGEFVAILGPNGAGKTTFLRILGSLCRPNMGKVQISGRELPDEAAEVRRRLGVVSHMPLLYGDLSAEENLRFYGRLYSVNRLDGRITDVLAQVGLSDRRKDLVRTFSRGMQQRLSIGRAVLHEPDVLLFDEPHTGLDQDACEMLDRLLIQVAEQGHTIVMASHDLARVSTLARASMYYHGAKFRLPSGRATLPRTGCWHFTGKPWQVTMAEFTSLLNGDPGGDLERSGSGMAQPGNYFLHAGFCLAGDLHF